MKKTKKLINRMCNYMIKIFFDIDDDTNENESDKDDNSIYSNISEDEIDDD